MVVSTSIGQTKTALAPLKGTGKLGGNRGSLDAANKASVEVADAYAQKLSDTILPLRNAGRTLQQTADTLNTTGVKTAKGGKWYAKTVSNVLKRL